MKTTRYEDFLTFAINNEIEAAKLYERFAGELKTGPHAKLLKKLAGMERDHEVQLQQVKNGLLEKFGAADRAVDLQLADFMVERPLSPESSIEDIVLFAIKSEQKAFELYEALASLEHQDASTRELLRQLADEERKHKFDLESEFEREFFREN
jgi:rubrerythrin